MVCLDDLLITEDQYYKALSMVKQESGSTRLTPKQLENFFEICLALKEALQQSNFKLQIKEQFNSSCPDSDESPNKLIEVVNQKLHILADFHPEAKHTSGKLKPGNETTGFIGYLRKKGFTKMGKQTIINCLKASEII